MAPVSGTPWRDGRRRAVRPSVVPVGGSGRRYAAARGDAQVAEPVQTPWPVPSPTWPAPTVLGPSTQANVGDNAGGALAPVRRPV